MTRLISFNMTQAAVLARQKTVTRRIGWEKLKPGTVLRGVDRAMWLRKWESPRTLAMIRVVSVRRERLDAIDADDVVREGLPEATTPEAFVQRFCRAMKCRPDDLVTRIEFEYLPEGEQ